MKTDVALVALSTLEQDARTLNLARALHAAGLSVTVLLPPLVDNIPLRSSPGRIPADQRDSVGPTFMLSFVGWIIRREWLPGWICLHLARLGRTTAKNAALIYDMREFYFALGPLMGKGLKQKVLEIYERRLLRSVDMVIVSAPMDAEIAQLHYGLHETPAVVMNTPPYQAPVESSMLRDRFSIPAEHAVAVYQGVVHHGRGLAPFMQAMSLMPDVHLCIVGDGPATRELEATADDLGVGARVHWHGSVAYDELHQVTCSADLGLSLIEPVSQSYEYALPNKLFEYMMAGIPSLVTDLPALRQQIQEIPAGVLVGKGLSPTEIKDAVDRVRTPATRDAMREAAANVRSVSYEQQARIAVDLVPGAAVTYFLLLIQQFIASSTHLIAKNVTGELHPTMVVLVRGIFTCLAFGAVVADPSQTPQEDRALGPAIAPAAWLDQPADQPTALYLGREVHHRPERIARLCAHPGIRRHLPRYRERGPTPVGRSGLVLFWLWWEQRSFSSTRASASPLNTRLETSWC